MWLCGSGTGLNIGMILMCALLAWRALLLDWEVEAAAAVARSASTTGTRSWRWTKRLSGCLMWPSNALNLQAQSTPVHPYCVRASIGTSIASSAQSDSRLPRQVMLRMQPAHKGGLIRGILCKIRGSIM